MTNEQRQMLSLLDAALHGTTPEMIAPEDWTEVYSELKKQTVEGIPAALVPDLDLKNEDKLAYMNCIGKNMRFFHALMKEQSRIIALLEEHGISCIILKGASAAVQYPHPQHRDMGDIDLLVKQNQFEEAYDVLKEDGCKTEDTLENVVRHIHFDTRNGITVELHERFSSGRDEEQNRILDQLLRDGIDRRETVRMMGYSFPVLPTAENGAVLLGHINQHLGGGLGLRQILDWMCYVEKHLDDELWNEWFERIAEDIGLKQLAIHVTALCAKYLGLRSKATWFRDISDTDLQDELIEYILDHGNFGRNDSIGSAAVGLIRVLRNPVQGLKTAQQCGCRTWKALDKCPRLKPVAWAYQLCRWIHHGLKHGLDMKTMKYYSRKEQRETELLRKLGVTRL